MRSRPRCNDSAETFSAVQYAPDAEDNMSRESSLMNHLVHNACPMRNANSIYSYRKVKAAWNAVNPDRPAHAALVVARFEPKCEFSCHF